MRLEYLCDMELVYQEALGLGAKFVLIPRMAAKKEPAMVKAMGW